MKKGSTKLLVLQLITLIILIYNAFINNIFTNLYLAIFLSIVFVISYFLVGFEKERFNQKKRNIRIIIILTISLLVIKYGLGLITGYQYSPYNRTLLGILDNTLSIAYLLVICEILRYTFVTKGNKLNFILTIIIFTLAYLNITTSLTSLTSLKTIVILLTTDIVVTLFENIVLTIISKKYGYSGSLSYTLIMNLYLYIVPIFPNLGEYLDAAVMIAFPIILYLFSNYILTDFFKEKVDIRVKNTGAKLIRFIIVMIIIIMVSLNSGIFRYWICVVASGSMEPTIKIGDVIYIDKSYKKNIDKIEEQDIIVFKINGKIYCHRVIQKKVNNDQVLLVTKGDREGQSVDKWTISKSELVGKVDFRIKYIGLPSVWLKNAIER
ncbi:MAG: signal peptidase I [Bacilli bacterium]|nr:signal peptidase I [Bacilli bacterium]